MKRITRWLFAKPDSPAAGPAAPAPPPRRSLNMAAHKLPHARSRR